MRAAWYDRKGPADQVLQVGELPRPAPAAGEVLVAVHASGVNPSDVKNRSLFLGPDMPFPRVVPHQDGAGIVAAVGDGVDGKRIGERVWLYEAQLGRPFGTAADYVCVPARQAVPLPDHVGFAAGACLGVPALTAHHCVFADGPVEGQTILVTGGGGTVAGHAIRFASRKGARVIATAGNAAQAERAREAGADLVLDRAAESWDGLPGLPAGSDGRFADRVVEVAFGANLDRSLRVLKTGGVIASYNSDAVPEPRLPYARLALLNATIRFVRVYAMSEEAHARAVAAVSDGLREGWLEPRAAARLPLDRIAQAHILVETGTAGGKVVLDITA